MSQFLSLYCIIIASFFQSSVATAERVADVNASWEAPSSERQSVGQWAHYCDTGMSNRHGRLVGYQSEAREVGINCTVKDPDSKVARNGRVVSAASLKITDSLFGERNDRTKSKAALKQVAASPGTLICNAVRCAWRSLWHLGPIPNDPDEVSPLINEKFP